MKLNDPNFQFKKQKWEYIYNYLNKIEKPIEIRNGKKYYNQITFQNTIEKTNNEFTRRYHINGDKFWEELKEYYKKTSHLSPK